MNTKDRTATAFIGRQAIQVAKLCDSPEEVDRFEGGARLDDDEALEPDRQR